MIITLWKSKWFSYMCCISFKLCSFN